jgi:CBS domain-containing protein
VIRNPEIIEDLDKNSQIAVFQSLDEEKAAEVLEEIETDIQVSIIDTLSEEKASDILEIMPSDEAADILEEIEDDRAQKLLNEMEAENSSEIRELMEYDEKTVGALMTKEFISFLPDTIVEKVLIFIKENKPKEEDSHYIYLTNNKNKLIGVVTILELITADSTANNPATAIDLTFTDDAVWRNSITEVLVNSVQIPISDVTLASGKLTLVGSLFPTAGIYNIVIVAKGYNTTSVNQTIVSAS